MIMNLIRNTLLTVLLIQFIIGLLYVKFFHTKKSQKVEKLIVTQKKIELPLSTEYTDTEKIKLPKLAKNMLIEKPIEKIDFNHQEDKTILKQKVNIKKVTKKLNNKKIKVVKNIKKPTLPKKHIVQTKKRIKPKTKLTTKIEKYAKKMLGKKYVWGATGPKCYDCSGFTQRVYRKVAGVKLPRVSYLQAKVGKRIPFNKLKQGDMVFFDTEKKRTGRVNHVGIYLSNGNFIHASSGGKKVMITNFRKKRFYRNRFLWGQRVIKVPRKIATKSSLKKLSSKG
jgi:cell wall-associated NlpC family hydrolase